MQVNKHQFQKTQTLFKTVSWCTMRHTSEKKDSKKTKAWKCHRKQIRKSNFMKEMKLPYSGK